MTKIHNDCRLNAIGMLKSRPEFLIGEYDFGRGDIGRYYIVDGQLWAGFTNGTVFRCDDHEEQEVTLRILKSSDKWKGRTDE